MKSLFMFLAFALALPHVSQAGDYQSTLLVQTGQLRESDLIVRTISDLESNRICLAFYVRTTGTSPVMSCHDVVSGFRSRVGQVGHFKEGKLIVRKLNDFENGVSCLVTYVSTEGTSPAIDCYKSTKAAAKYRSSGTIMRSSHLKEGDLDVYKIVDPDSTKSCLIAYVNTGNTSPSLKCYNSAKSDKGGLVQNSHLREGDLIARKIVDQGNAKECLITYVSTEGTSPHIYCAEQNSRPLQPQRADSKPAPAPAKR